MTTTDTAPALFDTPTPTAPTTRPRGKHPPTIIPDESATGAPEQAPLDPSRWVVVGWRDAERVTLTREQILAVFNAAEGPCAGCGTAHHRYGEGGTPLCPACRTSPRIPSKEGP
jgi:hypothetical protein